MLTCQKCNKEFKVILKIDEKRHNLGSRKFCLECSPFKSFNRRNLGNLLNAQKATSDKERWCKRCESLLPIENFYWRENSSKKAHAYCKKCCSKITVERQTDNKQIAVDYKGGKCCCCDYDRTLQALEFHHVNPEGKDLTLCNSKVYTFENIQRELDKCICVCANCHREIHSGNILLVIEENGSGENRTLVVTA